MDALLRAAALEEDQKKRLDLYKELIATALTGQSVPDCRALLDHLMGEDIPLTVRPTANGALQQLGVSNLSCRGLDQCLWVALPGGYRACH
jgi:hypothetical protein